MANGVSNFLAYCVITSGFDSTNAYYNSTLKKNNKLHYIPNGVHTSGIANILTKTQIMFNIKSMKIHFIISLIPFFKNSKIEFGIWKIIVKRGFQ